VPCSPSNVSGPPLIFVLPSATMGLMRASCLSACLAASLSLLAITSQGAPRHAICADLGPTLGVGVSYFSAVGDWPQQASQQYGVAWKFFYQYVVPTSDPPQDVQWWLRKRGDDARSVGAIPVYTFYELLQLGQQSGKTGQEADVVKQTLQDPALMRTYFDNFVFVVETLATETAPVIVHVEPDSWGFMMWAMGVEGNADATSVPAAVASSGHPDLVGLADHAGGLGQALVRLRDLHGPSIRLAWHASNFRVGTRPDVTTGFYASMGEWDVLFTDTMHLEAEDSTWWEPWDETRLKTNLAWMSHIVDTTGLPMLIWQAPLGTTDWHLFAGDDAMLQRVVQAGLGGVLFDMRGSGSPDDYRAYESAALAAVPPAGSDAGGTAADMRDRVAAYSASPMPWPEGSPCAHPADASTADARPDAATADAKPDAATAAEDSGTVPQGSGTPPSSDGGCACTSASASTSGSPWLLLAIVGAILRRAR
jgi:MYXO-CTERM domain-containing protein